MALKSILKPIQRQKRSRPFYMPGKRKGSEIAFVARFRLLRYSYWDINASSQQGRQIPNGLDDGNVRP